MPVSTPPKTRPLGERLIDAGLLTSEQLRIALKEQKRTKEMLGRILVRLGFTTQEQIEAALAQESGTVQKNLEFVEIDLDAVKLINEETARKYKLIPVSREGEVLTVAMVDTFDVVAIDEVQNESGLDVNVIAASEKDVLEAINKYCGFSGSIDEVVDQALAEGLGRDRADQEAQEAPIIRLVNQLILRGINEAATDIHFEPDEKVLRIRYRLDGALQQGFLLPKQLQPSVIARIKILADLNIAESRIPQDGKIRFQIGKKDIDLRVSTLPTIYGENVVMRILDKSKVLLGLEDLGFSPQNLEIFTEMIQRPHGIILVTGPTGSGKTTTLYTALSHINSLDKKICTLEDPVEYQLSVIRQTQINEEIGMTFAAGLRSLLRQDPDVILVGEMRDTETAEMAIRAALTGHLVFSTLHTNDAAGALPRLIDMGLDPYLLASSIIMVLAQRLVRKICPDCKEAYTVPAEELRALGLAEMEGFSFYRGAGCDKCNQSGYRGRAAIYELLPVDHTVHDLILQGASSVEIQKSAMSQGMTTMRNDGFKKVVVGLTTLDEVMRLT
ncbi:MAG: type II/IV secretion system protein [Deltaproteobacteria bacterium]|nr:type II/IV secretion system protein [Deltaproteobacteria bacterium]